MCLGVPLTLGQGGAGAPTPHTAENPHITFDPSKLLTPAADPKQKQLNTYFVFYVLSVAFLH